MEKTNLFILIKNILSRPSKPEEKEALDKHFYDAFQTEEWDEAAFGERADIQQRILSQVQERTRKKPRLSLFPTSLKPFYAYAAALLIFMLLGFAIYYMRYSGPTPETLAQAEVRCQDSILSPGSDVASLALSDGTVLELDELEVGQSRAVGDFLIKKNAQGSLEYVFQKSSSADEKALNTLQTPLGGTHKITLADGTRIWLNAGSTLTFPSVFAQERRIVQVTGEAYFEVQHDSTRPFVVQVKGVDVQVLGTTFNVSAYTGLDKEEDVTVALLSGAVQLKKDKLETRLTPGRKAKLAANQFQLTNFDPETEIAWKEDYFVFKDENIKTIMNELARWYKAEVVYQGDDWADKNFTVRISRKQDIGEILALIELTKSLKFKIKGRRIIVST